MKNARDEVRNGKVFEHETQSKASGLEQLEDRLFMNGDTLGTAVNVGTLNGTRTFNDSVSVVDVNDYYRFNIASQGNFSLALTGLSADADVSLLDSNGGVITSSTKGGSSSESINRTLNAGNYYAKVYRYSGNTNYSLSLTAAAQTTGGVGSTTPVRMSSGFYYPLPSATSSDTNWLAQGSAYVDGKVHFGSDLAAARGTPVFAVAAGTVIGRQADGFGNEVVFVQHQSNSGPFVAVYGHIQACVSIGATLTAGQKLGTVADYNLDNIGSNDHLHFGIRPGTSIPPSDGVNYGWGRANITWYRANGTNGFVAPIAFLNGHTPLSSNVPPAVPTNFRFTRTGTGRGILYWNDNSNNESGFQLQWYNGSSWVTWYTASPSVTSAGVNLSAGYTYLMRVVAYNQYGSTISNVISVAA